MTVHSGLEENIKTKILTAIDELYNFTIFTLTKVDTSQPTVSFIY